MISFQTNFKILFFNICFRSINPKTKRFSECLWTTFECTHHNWESWALWTVYEGWRCLTAEQRRAAHVSEGLQQIMPFWYEDNPWLWIIWKFINATSANLLHSSWKKGQFPLPKICLMLALHNIWGTFF